MEFCPKCGCILLEDRRRKVLICKKCKYERAATGSEGQRFVEEINKKPAALIVKEEPAEGATLPVTKAECKKCGNNKAYYWMMQTRSADEPSTRFYRCTECGCTWREYE